MTKLDETLARIASMDEAIVRVNGAMNSQMEAMTAAKCPECDIVFMDTVVRPFLIQMERARQNPNAGHFISSAEWLITLLISETLLNTLERKPEVLVPEAQAMLMRIAQSLSTALQAAVQSSVNH